MNSMILKIVKLCKTKSGYLSLIYLVKTFFSEQKHGCGRSTQKNRANFPKYHVQPRGLEKQIAMLINLLCSTCLPLLQ